MGAGFVRGVEELMLGASLLRGWTRAKPKWVAEGGGFGSSRVADIFTGKTEARNQPSTRWRAATCRAGACRHAVAHPGGNNVPARASKRRGGKRQPYSRNEPQRVDIFWRS